MNDGHRSHDGQTPAPGVASKDDMLLKGEPHADRTCPTDEEIAGYLDDTLSAEHRQAVEQHLSTCEDCQELLAEIVRTLEDLDEADATAAEGVNAAGAEAGGAADSSAAGSAAGTSAAGGNPGVEASGNGGVEAGGGPGTAADGPSTKPGRMALPASAPTGREPLPFPEVRPPRARRYWPMLGALAAAALLVVVVRDPIAGLLGLGTSPARARHEAQAALVTAVAEQRTFEARLSGGYRYAPVQGVMRSGAPHTPANPDLAIAVAHITQIAEKDRSPEAQALSGTSLLLAGEIDQAIEKLNAASLEPENATILSDLAAAYYVRAERRGNRDDYINAFNAARRAVELNPHLLEARFNLALATEQLRPGAEARAAWQAYLQEDPSSHWSEEARRHLTDLQRGS